MNNRFPYIVVEGPIGVGKTSLATRLADRFGSELLLEKADENPFLRNFYSNPDQYALSTQLFFLLQRANQVQDFGQADLFQGSRVADFMVDKDRIFAQLILGRDEFSLYQQIFDHVTLDAPHPDLVIFLQAPVDTLRERVIRRGIDYEQSIQDDYLTGLSDAYVRFFHDYDDSPLLTVNTHAMDLVNNQDDFLALLAKIEDIHCGRHYFNRSSFEID